MSLLRRLARIAGLIALGWLGLVLVFSAVWRVLPPVSTPMLAAWATFSPAERVYAPLDAIAPALVRAVVASEDARFCAHRGVDLVELRAAARDLWAGGRGRGASTITMQVARNLFLWRGRDPLRKVIELPLAAWLDFVWPKSRILEVYLNIAEWGPGVFGAEAGARRHFRRSAAALTSRQAALMAAALPNPLVRDPGRPGRGLIGVANRLERKLRSEDTPLDCL